MKEEEKGPSPAYIDKQEECVRTGGGGEEVGEGVAIGQGAPGVFAPDVAGEGHGCLLVCCLFWLCGWGGWVGGLLFQGHARAEKEARAKDKAQAHKRQKGEAAHRTGPIRGVWVVWVACGWRGYVRAVMVVEEGWASRDVARGGGAAALCKGARPHARGGVEGRGKRVVGV